MLSPPNVLEACILPVLSVIQLNLVSFVFSRRFDNKEISKLDLLKSIFIKIVKNVFSQKHYKKRITSFYLGLGRQN